jgi:hypothetical protein
LPVRGRVCWVVDVSRGLDVAGWVHSVTRFCGPVVMTVLSGEGDGELSLIGSSFVDLRETLDCTGVDAQPKGDWAPVGGGSATWSRKPSRSKNRPTFGTFRGIVLTPGSPKTNVETLPSCS